MNTKIGFKTARSLKLLQAGWSLVQSLEHRRIDQKAMASYLGLMDSTFSNWMIGATELAQIEALLRFLERLPDPTRASFLRTFLRPCPSLDAPALAHDAVAVAGLRSLLAQPTGIYFIQSERDDLRSYVISAFGHEASRVGSSQRFLSGLDIHGEDVFVPVPGVRYLGDPH
jgi:predicted XRE-type DNA-binding protein